MLAKLTGIIQVFLLSSLLLGGELAHAYEHTDIYQDECHFCDSHDFKLAIPPKSTNYPLLQAAIPPQIIVTINSSKPSLLIPPGRAPPTIS